KRTQGYVVPDSFTHGSSQQRISYFTKGFQSGDMRQCQTIR
ncbi:MAG: neutral zinc metallopeptidase, partial [Pyrinomonadaceae bacterium]